MNHGRTRRVRNKQTGAQAGDKEVVISPEGIANTAASALISGLVTGLVVNKIVKGEKDGS
jgi:hypothetical protein